MTMFIACSKDETPTSPEITSNLPDDNCNVKEELLDQVEITGTSPGTAEWGETCLKFSIKEFDTTGFSTYESQSPYTGGTRQIILF